MIRKKLKGVDLIKLEVNCSGRANSVPDHALD